MPSVRQITKVCEERCRPYGTQVHLLSYPGLPSWALLLRPCGTGARWVTNAFAGGQRRFALSAVPTALGLATVLVPGLPSWALTWRPCGTGSCHIGTSRRFGLPPWAGLPPPIQNLAIFDKLIRRLADGFRLSL